MNETIRVVRTFFILLVFVLIAQYSHAQSLPPGDKESAWVMVNDSIAGGLVLDTAQRSLLLDIEKRYQRGFDELIANDTLSDAAANERAKQLTAQRDQEIKAVMTAEQYEQWTRMTATGPRRNTP